MKKLQIGSGDRTSLLQSEGWTTIDPDVEFADYRTAVPPLPVAVLSETWDVIEMIHVIEHFYRDDALTILSSCYDILKADGVLILEMPNLEFAARVVLGEVPENKLARPLEFNGMYAIYGDQSRRNRYYQHLWGYTPETMRETLAGIGFSRISLLPAQYHWPHRDFRVEARR